MSGQRFYASPDTFTWNNGAIGHCPGGPFDCLGPYAKVRNCPVYLYSSVDQEYVDTGSRLTCYAQRYANSYYSVPAATRKNGKHVGGYFTHHDGDGDGGCIFVARADHWARAVGAEN